MLVLLVGADDCLTARDATVGERLTARLRSGTLDRDLACGVSPDASAPLELRAQALERMSARRELARTLRRLLAEADAQVPRRRSGVVPIMRDTIRDASDEFRILIEHLLAPGPVSAQGVAQIRLLLQDGSGPLFHRGAGECLRTCLQKATAALQPL
jgi:hypothetical protein